MLTQLIMQKTAIFFVLLSFIGCAISKPTPNSAVVHATNSISSKTELPTNNSWLALGMEPYWNVVLKEGQQIIFTSLGDIDSMVFPSINPITKADGTVVFKSKTEEGKFELTLKKEPCSDGMSDESFTYSSQLKIENLKESKQLSGCGKFIQPQMLNASWALTHFKKQAIKEGKPTLILNLTTYKIAGNAGCNSYGGSFSLKNDQILFSKNIMVMRMTCENQSGEDLFLAALAGNRYVYEITDNTLVLKTEGHPILVFKKME